MRPLTLFLCLLLIVVIGNTQKSLTTSTLSVPGYFDSTRVIAFGDSFVTTIRNTGTTNAVFFIKYRKPGLEYLGYSDDSTLAILRRAVTEPQSDSATLQMILAEANVIKSFLFRDGLVLATPTDSLTAAKQESITGGYNSIYHQICGNFTQRAATDLHNADPILFPWENFRIITLTAGVGGGHTVLEIKINGNWVMFDFTPGMPLLSPGVSTGQIVLTPSFLTDSFLYRYDSIMLPGDHSSLSAYKAIFTHARLSYNLPDTISYPVSGIQILSPGSTLTYTGVVNTLMVDTTQIQGKQFFQAAYPVIVSAYSTGNNILFDSLTELVEYYYPDLTEVQAASIFADHSFPHYFIGTPAMLSRSASGLFWSHTPPVKQLTIPASTRSLVIGKDVKICSFVVSAVADGDITVEDTSYADFNRTFWISGSSLLTTGGNQLNYLDTGIIPANTSVAFLLSYNPERENAFFGFDIEKFDTGMLTVATQYFSVWHTATDIISVTASKNISVFPVPAENYIVVEGLNPGTILNITDVAGRILSTSFYNGNGRFTINISNLAAGIYFANNKIFVRQ